MTHFQGPLLVAMSSFGAWAAGGSPSGHSSRSSATCYRAAARGVARAGLCHPVSEAAPVHRPPPSAGVEEVANREVRENPQGGADQAAHGVLALLQLLQCCGKGDTLDPSPTRDQVERPRRRGTFELGRNEPAITRSRLVPNSCSWVRLPIIARCFGLSRKIPWRIVAGCAEGEVAAKPLAAFLLVRLEGRLPRCFT